MRKIHSCYSFHCCQTDKTTRKHGIHWMCMYREKYMPPAKLTDLDESFLTVYHGEAIRPTRMPLNRKSIGWILNGNGQTYKQANGKVPNAVASGLGMASLYRTNERCEIQKACDKDLCGYQKSNITKRCRFHLPAHRELWTIPFSWSASFWWNFTKLTGDE